MRPIPAFTITLLVVLLLAVVATKIAFNDLSYFILCFMNGILGAKLYTHLRK